MTAVVLGYSSDKTDANKMGKLLLALARKDGAKYEKHQQIPMFVNISTG